MQRRLLDPGLLAPLLLAGLGTWAAAGQTRDPTLPVTPAEAAVVPARLLDIRQTPSLDELLPQLADQRVIHVGEAHTDYAHHLQQLAILRALHRQDPRLAIGMEMFQQPFQGVLDDYVAGRIEEAELLARSEWYERWRHDFRLYRPILQFARAQGLPVIALNVPRELTERVAKLGIDGLGEADRQALPQEFDRSDLAYEQRLREVFAHHPHQDRQEFQRFLEAQLLWDEGMAQRAAEFLVANPEHRLVILAGSGHLMHGYGIPNRLARRLPLRQRVILPAGQVELAPGVADYLLFAGNAELPPAGLLGVRLEEPAKTGGQDETGSVKEGRGVEVAEAIAGGAAERAGIRKGDRILEVAGRTIATYADLKIALLDRPPGETVSVRVGRDVLLLGSQELLLDVTLEADTPHP
jgi:uncharacterized iron-regulated protein